MASGWLTVFALAPLLTVGGPVDQTAPVVIHTACAEYRTGVPFTVRVQIQDASRLFDPKVFYRSALAEQWVVTPLEPDPAAPDFSAVIPKTGLRSVLEYRIEVFDEFGNGPTRVGTIDAPLRVLPSTEPAPCQQVPGELTLNDPALPGASEQTIEAQPLVASTPELALMSPESLQPEKTGFCTGSERPFYCTPLFWGLVGGAVATTAAVVTLALHPWSSSSKPGVPRHVTVSIQGTPPTR